MTPHPSVPSARIRAVGRAVVIVWLVAVATACLFVLLDRFGPAPAAGPDVSAGIVGVAAGLVIALAPRPRRR